MKRQGVILGMVVVMAVVMTIASYAALVMAVSMARQPTPMDETILRARFASDSGVAWARERLYDNADNILGRLQGAGTHEEFDSNDPRYAMLKQAGNGMHVKVTVTNTGSGYAIESKSGF